MKKILLFITLSIAAIPAFPQNDTAKKYFEGIIEYEIKSESHMPGVSDNEIRERNGSVMRLYFKDGTYVREYLDNAGFTLLKMFYKKDMGNIYVHDLMLAPDTIFFTSETKVFYTDYSIKPGKNETVLDCECSSWEIHARYTFPFMSDTGKTVITYFFCPTLPVNPEWYKNMYVWKDVVSKAKSIATKFIEDDEFTFKQTFTAKKILWQPLSDDIFKIDPKFAVSEIKKE